MAPKRKAPDQASSSSGSAAGTKQGIGNIQLKQEDKDTQASQALVNGTDRKKYYDKLSYWLKSQASDADKSTWATCGNDSQKREYLLKWLVWKAKQASGDLHTLGWHSVENQKESGKTYEWMALEKMQKEFGEQKSKAWIDSGKLESRPDPVTGSEEAHMKEYKIWSHTGKDMWNEKVGHGLNHDDKSPENKNYQLELMKDLFEIDNTGEKASEAEDQSETFKNLKSKGTTMLLGVQSKVVEAKKMFHKTTAEKNKYAGAIHEDIKKIIPKLTKLYKAIEAITVTGTPQDNDIHKASEEYDRVMNEYQALQDCASRFMSPPKKKAKTSALK